MNERLEATIICCARLADGVKPAQRADSFLSNVQSVTGLTKSGLENFPAIKTIFAEIYRHGDVEIALREAGL